MSDKPEKPVKRKPVAKIKVTVTIFDDDTYEKEWTEEVCRGQKDVRQFIPSLHAALALSTGNILAGYILKVEQRRKEAEHGLQH